MGPEDLYQRQLQIQRLHKRIREYKLTTLEEKQLQRNKLEQETLIETKFSSSTINQQYKFPKLSQDDESPCLGSVDVINLTTADDSDVEGSYSSVYAGDSLSKKTQRQKPQGIFQSLAYHSVRREPSQLRDSPSLGANRTFDSRSSLNNKLKYPSVERGEVARLVTEPMDFNKSNKNFLKEGPLSQNIKSIVRLKSHYEANTSKDTLGSKEQMDSCKSSTFKHFKHILGQKGKENNVKERLPNNKHKYDTNCTTRTEGNRNNKDCNKSQYQTNTSTHTTGSSNTKTNLTQTLLTTSKWVNKIQIEEEIKVFMRKPTQEEKKTLKKRDCKRIGLNQTLNQTLNTRPKTKMSEVKRDSNYYSKMFQSIRSKNSPPKTPSEGSGSYSRIPIGLLSPLDCRYFEYKQVTLTNR